MSAERRWLIGLGAALLALWPLVGLLIGLVPSDPQVERAFSVSTFPPSWPVAVLGLALVLLGLGLLGSGLRGLGRRP